MEITKLALSNTCHITVFHGKNDYSLSKRGDILHHGGKFIESNFSNKKLFYNAHILKRYSKITDSIVSELYYFAGIETSNPLEDLNNFLLENSIDVTDENLWIIMPKNTKKKLSGKPFKMEFEVGALDFGYGNRQEELDVYMTPITKTSKSVKFSVRIPEFLYRKCLTDNEEDKRPKVDYIESEMISSLHSQMASLVSQAHKINEIEKEAAKAKKVLCINFNSTERATRDDFNFGYTGQEIKTNFNFYVAYLVKSESFLNNNWYKLFTYNKLQTGMGSTERGIKGIINSELKGIRNWITISKPNVIIDWTQEKEDFLIELEQEFRKLSERLNEFLSDLNEEKLQHLIDNKKAINLLPNSIK